MEFIIEVEILVLSVICDKEIFLFFYSCTFVGFEKKEEQATNSGTTKYRFFTFYTFVSHIVFEELCPVNILSTDIRQLNES
jgi:hypothetical protein